MAKTLALRDYTLDDIPLIVEALNNPAVTRYLSSRIPQPYTVEDAQWWIEEGSKSEFVNAIELDGKFVGTVGVKPGQFEYSHSGEIGYWLAEPWWGQGLATRAVRMMISETFESTEIVRLVAPVFAPNKASQAVLLKCGFEIEAVQQKALFKNGEFFDQCLFALLA